MLAIAAGPTSRVAIPVRQMSDPAVHPKDSTARSRRVLLVSYYFPPSGGPGVQRALKFVKYLPEFGWDPVVLTVDPRYASYPALDPALVDEVDSNIRVVRTRAWDPYSLYARMLGKSKEQSVGVGFIDESQQNWRQMLGKWVRGNVFIPDARVGWIPYATRAGKKLLANEHFDAILTTGPPHSTHLIGKRLAQKSGVPWLADFRDPWTGIDFYDSLMMTDFSKRRDARLEEAVTQKASVIVAVTPGMVRSLGEKAHRDVQLVMNGYDPADIEIANPSKIKSVLSYVGNMNAARNPIVLWQALKRLSADGHDFGDFAVRLVGPIDRGVAQSVREHGLEKLVQIEPPVSHAEAVTTMLESALLLLVINRVSGSEGIMTGKLFEYIGTGRPILGIGPPNGDAAAALRDSNAGVMFDWDDVDGVTDYLKEYLSRQDGTVGQVGASIKDRTRFSRREQAGQLAGLLSGMVDRTRRTPSVHPKEK